MSYLALFLVALGVGLYFGAKKLKDVQPTDDEVIDDLKELKTKVAPYKGGFMPWTDEISSNEINQILTKDNARTGDGVFLSNTNDPIFAYAYKNYIGPGKNGVIYILSAEHEYIFRITNKGTEITIDGEKKGLIRDNGKLYDLKNDEIAAIKKHEATSTNKIYIGEEEIAKIALPDSLQTKALHVHKIDLAPLEKEIIQTFTVYELVHSLTEKEG
jgi:hypothetical protein